MRIQLDDSLTAPGGVAAGVLSAAPRVAVGPFSDDVYPEMMPISAAPDPLGDHIADEMTDVLQGWLQKVRPRSARHHRRHGRS